METLLIAIRLLREWATATSEIEILLTRETIEKVKKLQVNLGICDKNDIAPSRPVTIRFYGYKVYCDIHNQVILKDNGVELEKITLSDNLF